MFWRRRCLFGQTGSAQSHLANNGVGVGDVFVFFGLFQDEGLREPHHRIFAYMKVEKVLQLGARPNGKQIGSYAPRCHPHTMGEWNENNTVYLGEGSRSRTASSALRLTASDHRVSIWRVPTWLRQAGLTYHQREARWLGDGMLNVAARGQEFITDIGSEREPRIWLDKIIAEVKR